MRKFITLVTIAFAIAFQADAQTRTINVEVKLLDPVNNDIVYIGNQFNITTQIKNLGPDTLTQNDTVAFSLVFNGSKISFGNPPIDHIDLPAPYLLPGDSIADNIQFTLGQGWPTGPTTICSIMMPRNESDSIIDPDTTNNMSCVNVDVRNAVSINGTTLSKESVSVYPNPTSSVTYFDLRLDKESDVQITITDMMGRTVIKNVQSLGSGQHKVKIDTDKLPSGNYLYNVNIGGNMTKGKLQVQ